jgi:hypothetical protein
MRGAIAALAGVVSLAACSSPQPTPPQEPRTLEIRTQPINVTCLQAGLGVPRVTLWVDPFRSDQIWAVADSGTRFPIVWPDGFTARGSDRGWVVLDASGQVAGANGDVIVTPPAGDQTIRGRQVCFGDNTLSVMPTQIDAVAVPS